MAIIPEGEPGYFLAHRVPDDARSGAAALGVVAVKISLDDIEANWQRGDTMLEIHLAGTMTYAVEAASVDEAARRVA